MNNKISIIIPYFKKKKFINTFIKSITQQSYSNYEAVIIYDDSDRKDLETIRNKIQKLRKFKIIDNKVNKGVSKSRNIGIKNSSGRFIAFHDSDDKWKKNKLKIQIRYMKKNNVSFSHTNYQIVNESNKKIGKMQIKKYLSYKDLLKSCDIGLSTVMIEKKLLKNNLFPNLKTKEDYALWLKLAKKGIVIKGINNFLTIWCKAENSLSSNLFQNLSDAYKVYRHCECNNILTSILFTLRLSLNFLFKISTQKKNMYLK